jgi:hypothetical protein
MAAHTLDVEKFKRLAARHQLKNRREISAASDVRPRTLSKAFNGGRVAVDTLMKLARAVGLGNDYHELILWDKPESSPQILLEEAEVTPTVLGGAAMHADSQDIKLLLTSRDLSRSLLGLKDVVSFAECLRATTVWTPINDAHKDHAIVPGLTYNHFVQPSVVVTLDVDDSANVVAYSRVKRPFQPSNVHTEGMSILIAGSPLWNVVRHKKSPLDHWLASTGDRKKATTQLLGGISPAILHFVQYKIDLLRYECRILPLGVITKDECRRSHKRVYTQFVFRVRLTVKAKNLDDFVSHIPSRGLFPYRLSDNIDPEQTFVSADGRVNEMDVVAWRALHGRAATLKFGSARFRRDFQIV